MKVLVSYVFTRFIKRCQWTGVINPFLLTCAFWLDVMPLVPPPRPCECACSWRLFGHVVSRACDLRLFLLETPVLYYTKLSSRTINSELFRLLTYAGRAPTATKWSEREILLIFYLTCCHLLWNRFLFAFWFHLFPSFSSLLSPSFVLSVVCGYFDILFVVLFFFRLFLFILSFCLFLFILFFRLFLFLNWTCICCCFWRFEVISAMLAEKFRSIRYDMMQVCSLFSSFSHIELTLSCYLTSFCSC